MSTEALDPAVSATIQPTPPYDRRYPLPALDRRGRKIQRLRARGTNLSIEVRFDGHRVRERWDGKLTTIWYARHDTPVWVVCLTRRSKDVFYDLLGWDNVRVENNDLDAAIDEALKRTRPRRVWLDDRVYEHMAWKSDFASLGECLVGIMGARSSESEAQ